MLSFCRQTDLVTDYENMNEQRLFKLYNSMNVIKRDKQGE